MENVSDGSRGQQSEEMAHWRREEIVARKEKVFKGRDVARGRLARSNTEMYQRVGTRVNVEARSMMESTSHLAREYPVASSPTGTLLSVYLGDGRRAPGRKREDKKSANLRRRVKRRPVLDASRSSSSSIARSRARLLARCRSFTHAPQPASALLSGLHEESFWPPTC